MAVLATVSVLGYVQITGPEVVKLYSDRQIGQLYQLISDPSGLV